MSELEGEEGLFIPLDWEADASRTASVTTEAISSFWRPFSERIRVSDIARRRSFSEYFLELMLERERATGKVEERWRKGGGKVEKR